MQAPPPPSITPRQMNLLRVVTSMAWSDGHLASEEIDLMLDRFSGMFAADAPQQQHLRQELQEYMIQNIPLEELTPKLQSVEERELVLRLGYEVIRSSARTPNEEKINEEEAAAYNKLVQLLGLPAEAVQRIEAEASTQTSNEGVVDSLTRKLEKFMQG
ncbi:TerB family tellurite resistance protein [Leptolyngbya sp. FACHB-671]|uniref:tellurite resistance TerB family protein n=1 Tax=Leptolyngbya sp. FACHB-671 TaxID=2692812 RepID=UPI001681CF79|nr:TerB family tellurite resistance protein [Leptolyngbya sp. FACHB-671]MBD1870410.1 TerB family tellurite resistance protein [Cyanobacteria bacterium FACHB-471]MBD2069905.1 TerB family tellurite resistance protein [Leptolyngbya sp. FACHB-671]